MQHPVVGPAELQRFELAVGIRADMQAGASLDELIIVQQDLERTFTLSRALLAEAGALLGPQLA